MSSESTDRIESLQGILRKMESALNLAADAIVWTDRDGDIEWCNSAFELLVGRLRTELIAVRLDSVTPLAPCAAPNPSRAVPFAELFQGRGKIAGRFQPIGSPGKIVEVAGEAVTSRGEVSGYVVSIREMPAGNGNSERELDLERTNRQLRREIAERERVETALRESEERYRNLFNNAPIGIYRTTPEGRILLANPTMIRMFLGEPAPDGFAVEYVSDIDGFAEEYPRAAFRELVEREGEIKGFEAAWRRRDRTVIHVRENAKAVRSPIDGSVLYYEGTIEDITERKMAEEALRQNEERYRNFFEHAAEMIFTTDFEGAFTSANRETEIRLGLTRTQLSGASLFDFVAPENTEAVRRVLADRVADSVTVLEIDLTAADNRRLPVEIGFRRISERGTDVGMQAVARDVSERRRAQELLQVARDNALEATRLKSQFLANMSHEIRTPLNGIVGMSHFLFSTDLTSKQREYVETIRNCGDTLLTIINDLLDLSKIEAGKINLEYLDFDLAAVIGKVSKMFVERARSKGLEFQIRIAKDVPSRLNGDPTRLRQVLMNLVGNAVKFTKKGGVTISVEPVQTSDTRLLLRFEVADTGIGIQPEARPFLFQAFSQADGSSARKYGGTGLGLAICRQLTELMGGKIGCEDNSGGGSRFWFTMKFNLGSGDAPLAETRDELRNLRVLVVDDNSTNREILNRQLSAWGMRVTEAEGGPKALELLLEAVEQGDPFDIAVLDMLMPGMDGMELARAVKTDSKLPSTKLVMLTSFTLRGHAEEAKRSGIAAYLSKPVSDSQLYDCLCKVVSASSENVLPPLITRYELGDKNASPRTEMKKKVLLVEDDEANQMVAKLILEKLGYQCEIAGNGLKALTSLSQNSYDLILMDCQMPFMDGYETTSVIREQEGQADCRIPIIALTGSAGPGDRERCLSAGMDDVVNKPYKIDEFRSVLEKWVKPGSIQ